MAEKACPFSPPLKTNVIQNNKSNLQPLHELNPPLIVISDSDTDLEGNISQEDFLDFGQEASGEKTRELDCLQYCGASQWRHFEEDDEEKSVKEGKNLCFRNEMPTPLPNSLKIEEQNKNNSEVSWEEYRSFLLHLWAEKYLSNLLTNKDSSTAELPGLNTSNDVPYIIDLLTEEGEECQSSFYKSVHENSSKLTNASAKMTQNITSTTHFQPQQQQQQLKQQQQQQLNTSTINSQSFPILEKTSQPLPLFNMAKETSKAQGEASGRPTLFLRSNAPLKPQEGGGGDEPSRRQALLSKMPFNFFVKREEHKPTNNSTKNQNSNFSLLDTRNKEEPPRNPSLPPPLFQNSESQSYFNKLTNQPTNCGSSEFCFHGNEIQNLKQELEKAQSRIANLSFKMNDQCSHLDQLMKERNVLEEKLNEFLRTNPHHLIPEMSYPLFTQQGYKTPHPAMYPPGIESYTSHQALGRRSSWQYPYELPRGRMTGGYKNRPEEFVSHLAGSDPRALENLRDRIVALQMQNIELNLFLKKEEIRRKEAEEAVKKEKEYVRKLQESIQDISSSTLIIDPLTYKQVADNYIASKKKPVRRTHTCNPYIGSSDLVCDSNRLQIVQNKNQSTSCPSSPLGPGHERKSSNSSSKAPPPSPTGTPFSESPSSDCSIYSLDKSSPSEVHDVNLSWNVESEIPSSTLSSHHQYQELLNNLDNLQVSSSPS